jgi:hypothetical protein
MDAQSVAHGLIVAFIIVGNIGFLMVRRGKRRAKGKGESA